MEIRIAEYAEREYILEFIDTYWQKNHIFVQWPELFDDYHRNGEMLNYVIAIDENTQKIYGVCGFIYANHKEKPDIWLALWKVIPSGNPTLGMDMVRYLYEKLNCNVLACCGIKKEVKRLYEFLGYQTGTLRHYYRLNENVNCTIAIIREKWKPIDCHGEAKLIEITSENQFDVIVDYEKEEFKLCSPYKDVDYIKKKYFHNMAYKYKVWAIKNKSEYVKAILITKCIEVKESKILRIVDFYGDEADLADCGKSLENLLKIEKCEYADFYQYGLSEETLKRLGMILRNEKDENIIPNYFEPFLTQNVDIHFFTNKLDNFRMFKADGDQERPNYKCKG